MLWKRLHNGFAGRDGELAQTLALNLISVCQEAYDRMKAFPSLHPEYTLHDEVHLLRVTELMSLLLPDEVADRLNPIEIVFLLLAAHFHDQGMVLEPPEIVSLSDDPVFTLFKDNWAISHSNLQEMEQRLLEKTLSESERARARAIEQELLAALLTDYVRQTHGARSAAFVRRTYATDPRWMVAGTNFADFVARLCLSHVRPARDLHPTNGFRHDEVVVSHKVNMPYLGLLLRLADLLDFDRDRTPDSLYRTIHFKSPVSLREWAKHRSVDGWVVQPNLIQFTMRSEHPEYQRAAYHFMDWIDRELSDAQAVCRAFPGSASQYFLNLPLSVDRSRIEPRDGAYIYSDLEFSLSRDEIVKLLMADKLYGHPWLCVRELLQNALDALRHRRALIRRDLGVEWQDGHIEMVHELDSDSYEVLKCTDNGVGMDRDVIERFLTRAGRSYYRSPEFEQERASFRATGFDFDPCAQFGIGFMSCFMLGDRITVRTRKDYGPGRGRSEPLVIEINGLSGIVVLRPGVDTQPIGTTVEITGRRKPSFLTKYEDNVRLVAMLDGYALATEFPIVGRCLIGELAGEVQVPPTIAVRRAPLERLGLRLMDTIEIPFASIEACLNGWLRGSFIVDEVGSPVMRTSEAEWVEVDVGNRKAHARDRAELVVRGEHSNVYSDRFQNVLCVDGVLVAGEPGRREELHSNIILGSRGSQVHCGPLFSYTLDVRGAAKPPLTPARTPPEDHFMLREKPRWERLQHWVNKAEGLLFQELTRRFGDRFDSDTFWTLALIYGEGNTSMYWMPARGLWTAVTVPISEQDGKFHWRKLSDLPTLELERVSQAGGREAGKILLRQPDGAVIGECATLRRWISEESDLTWQFTLLTTCMSTLVLTDEGIRLEVREPDEGDLAPGEFMLRWEVAGFLALLPFSGELSDFLAVQLPVRVANRRHPLAKLALESRWLEQRSSLQQFARALTRRLAEPEDFAQRTQRYWQKKIGHLFRGVNWDSVNREFHPPYKVYTAEGKVIEVTGQILESWADEPIEVDILE